MLYYYSFNDVHFLIFTEVVILHFMKLFDSCLSYQIVSYTAGILFFGFLFFSFFGESWQQDGDFIILQLVPSRVHNK